MLDNVTFETLQKRYSPIISNIINSNIKFYRTNQTIRWQFGFDERVAIFACCDRKTNIITVNIAAVDFSFQRKEPLHIEYFLLHEIRHIYQHLEIKDYKENPSKCNNQTLAEKWANEEANYIGAIDKNGFENKEYFEQDMEMDAFAYAYAVMKYKYGEVPYLYLPKTYEKDEFYGIVDEWMDTFERERL